VKKEGKTAREQTYRIVLSTRISSRPFLSSSDPHMRVTHARKQKKEKEKQEKKNPPHNQPTTNKQSIHPSQKHKIYDAKTFAHPPKTQAAAPNTLP